MRHLYDPSTAEDIRTRIRGLGSQAQRQWGRMDAAQALAHCAAGLELAVGDRVPPRLMLGRLIGGLIKPLALGNDQPMKRNSPTAPDLVVREVRNLETERARLLGLIDRFVATGPEGCTRHPHSFFGALTPQEWAVLMYKHLDHHLRQFGV